MRATTTLVSAGLAGFLIWLAAQYNATTTTGGYWADMGILAGAGLVIGLAQIRGEGGSPRSMFFVAFVPVLVVGVWLLVSVQPSADWFSDHLRNWDDDMGIGGVISSLSIYADIFAFGVGLFFGLVLEPRGVHERLTRRPIAGTESFDSVASEQPLRAERDETAVRPGPLPPVPIR